MKLLGHFLPETPRAKPLGEDLLLNKDLPALLANDGVVSAASTSEDLSLLVANGVHTVLAHKGMFGHGGR